MKLASILAVALAAPCFVAGNRVRGRAEGNAVVQEFYALVNSSTRFLNSSLFHVHGSGTSARKPPMYGSSRCPCIGIDDLDGTTEMHGGGEVLVYPADAGGRCEPWEEASHPDCADGHGPDWCHQAWCYVDPCDCNLDVPSKPSLYMEGSKYQGRPLHYSYATCGATDTFTSEEAKKQLKDNKATCAKPVDEKEYGKDGCHCIGIDEQDGKTMVKAGDKTMPYPADVGASCSAWDEHRHPDCTGPEAPSWCKEKWCYVDPCTCGLKTPPQESVYLPESTFQGRPIYYSYTACGSTDHFTETQGSTACTLHKDSKSCNDDNNERWCEWESARKVCLGKELTAVCGEVGGSGGFAKSGAGPSRARAAALAAAGCSASGALALML